MSQPPVHFEQLPNGLGVLLCETHIAPVAEIQIWASVGSADEREPEAGLAHFHEHMLFKGTEKRAVGEIAGEVEGAGGRINAYTSFDVTVYHATLPSTELSVGLDVLADATLHSSFDPDEISREVEVVLEEIRRGEDSPGHVLGNAVFAEAYHAHPYGAPILGPPESVARFDRERVRAFFERWYTPRNLCVVVAGDFDRERILDEVRAHFGDLPAGGAERHRPVEPLQQGLRTVILERPFERVSIEFAHPTVNLAHPDAPYLDLLAFILGSGDSSRLVRRVKERDSSADRIDASCYTPVDPGLFSVSIETDVERATTAVAATVRELERTRREPVGGDELEKARANFLAMEDFERESVSGLAQKLGSFHHLAGSWEVEQRYLETIRTATPDDLLRVSQEYLGPDRLTVGAVVPDGQGRRVDEAAIRAAVDRGVASIRRAYERPRKSDSGPDVIGYELPGGGALHVIPRPEVPVVAARAAFLGGLLAENAGNSGITAFLTSMWLRGTRGHSAADFARSAESLAIEIDGFCGRSSLGMTLEAPSSQLDQALDLFAEALLEPSLDVDEIERERRDTLAAIERREDRLGQRAFLLFTETHFQNHPYRQSLLGSEEAVASIDRAALEAHHAWLIRAPNLSLAVSGRVDPDAVAARVSARLSDLEAGAFERPAPPDEPPPREIRSAELRKDRAQAHLVIGFRGLTVADPDRLTLEVISQILAGQGGRLFLELRDRRSLAYSVSAMNVEGFAPGYFAVYIATSPEKFEDAHTGLLEELRKLVEAPPEDWELDRARRYLIGNFVIDQQRNAVHAAQVSLDTLYGLGPRDHAAYPERIAAVGKEDVLRVARRIIDLDAYTLATVRP